MAFSDQYDAIIRVSVFVGVFLILAGLELVLPRRQLSQSKAHRWFTNISLVVIDNLTLRVVMPVLMIGMAALAAGRGWGLLNWVNLPVWAEFIIAFLLLDLAIYAQHVATHKIPLLWRLHKVHHTDRDFDVSTGSRFHPFEILFSMAYKLVCAIIIGPSVIAVFIFEVTLNASTMFNHSNLKLPLELDRTLRAFIVTPDMHRVHHSIERRETDSNYGFFLSLWDRLFRTYIAQPKAGHDDITIGLPPYQDGKPVRLGWSLVLPFLPNDRTAKVSETSADRNR